MIDAKTIRLSMRISHDKLDGDIQRNIDTCLLDLKRVGVDTAKESELLDKACELYCKWQCDYMGKGEQHEKNYNALRDALSLSREYRERNDGE